MHCGVLICLSVKESGTPFGSSSDQLCPVHGPHCFTGPARTYNHAYMIFLSAERAGAPGAVSLPAAPSLYLPWTNSYMQSYMYMHVFSFSRYGCRSTPTLAYLASLDQLIIIHTHGFSFSRDGGSARGCRSTPGPGLPSFSGPARYHTYMTFLSDGMAGAPGTVALTT